MRGYFSRIIFLIMVVVLMDVMVIVTMAGCDQQDQTTTPAVTTGQSTTLPSTTASGTTSTETTTATSVTTIMTTTTSAAVTTSATTTKAPTTTTTASVSSLPTSTMAPLSVRDYFPLTPNVFYKYAGEGNEYVPMTVTVDYVWADKIQMAYDNGGTEVHKLYAVRNGQVQVIQSKPELYVREDLSQLPPLTNGEILLKEPMTIGTNWLVNGERRSITGVNVPVTTPAGSFKALEVTTQGSNTTTRQYYAAGIGFIKMTITGAYEITQTLEKRELNAVKTQNMTFYYPRMTQTKTEICYQEVPVQTRTNEGFKEILAARFSTPPAAGLQRIMSTNVTIHFVRIDPASNIVTIDVSANYKNEMMFGAEMEGAVIRCLVNTVGHAYGAERVILTLDGQPCEFSHVALDPGQSFKVNYEDMVRIG